MLKNRTTQQNESKLLKIRDKLLKIFISIILANIVFHSLDYIFNLKGKINHLDNYIYFLENFRLIIDSSLMQQDELILFGNFYLRGSKLIASENNSRFDPKVYYLYFDRETYERNFLGLSPFDRCTLKNLLIEVLRNSKEYPKALILDFDLSPLGHSNVSLQDQKFLKRVSKHYEKCENELFQFIHSLAEKGILIVLVKTGNGHLERLFEERYNSKNIKFASSYLNQLYGVTYYYDACVSVNEISEAPNKSLIYQSFCPEKHVPTIGGMLFSELINRNHKFDNYEDLRFFFEHVRKEKFEKNDIDGNSIVFIGSTVGDLHEAIFSEKSVPGVKIHAFGFMSLLRHYEIEKKKGFCDIILKHITSFLEELISFIFGYMSYKSSIYFRKFLLTSIRKIISCIKCLVATLLDILKLILLNFSKLINYSMKRFTEKLLEKLLSTLNSSKKCLSTLLNLITIKIKSLVFSRILREVFMIAIQIFIVIFLMLVFAGVYRFIVFEIARSNLIDFHVSFILYGLFYSLLERMYERHYEQNNTKRVIN